jgi:hypothetical protein
LAIANVFPGEEWSDEQAIETYGIAQEIRRNERGALEAYKLLGRWLHSEYQRPTPAIIRWAVLSKRLKDDSFTNQMNRVRSKNREIDEKFECVRWKPIDRVFSEIGGTIVDARLEKMEEDHEVYTIDIVHDTVYGGREERVEVGAILDKAC